MDTDDLNREDLPQKPVSNTSESKREPIRRSPGTFRRALSDEEFEKLANRTTERMLKSLHESSGDE
jgi:hypothetical protein